MDMMPTTGAPPPEGVCIPKMDMSLHWGACEWILVRTWKADTTGKFVFVAFLLFFATIAYEGLKFYREHLFLNARRCAVKFVKQPDGTVVRTEDNPTMKDKLLNLPHGFQTVLHGIQIFISYMLMLIVMLCNMWWIIAVCLGAAVGYFFFAQLRKSSNAEFNECCY